MRIFVAIALLAFGADLFLDDGERDGRRGNELYEDGAYDEAAEAFAGGLAVLSEDASLRLRYALHNNLGAALLKSGDAAGAREAFDRALSTAPSDVDLARSAYNAGNAAFASADLEAAIDFYRRSLLRSPDNLDAKFNYEFVKRQLEQQQDRQQQQGDSDQSGEDQDEQNQQDSDEQNQNGEQPQNEQRDGGSEQEPQNGESQEEESPPQEPSGERSEQLSAEQAERILQALQNEEEQLLRQVQRPTSRPRRVEKDW